MSKYSVIAEEIKKSINMGKYPVGGKLPTEYELVNKFGVSRQTIRQAISQLKNLGIVYQIQGSGTFVSSPEALRNKRKEGPVNVDVVCTYISDYIFPSIIRGIEKILSEKNISIRLAATENMIDKERKILEKVINNGSGTDALIVEGTKTGIPNPNIPLYKKIMEMQIPVVFLHCAYPELDNAIVVGMNEIEGGIKVVNYLISQGCKKIGGVFKIDDRQGLLRYKGFSDAVLSSGLKYEDCIIRWFTTEEFVRYGSFLSEIQLSEFDSLDGIVCYNDQIATSFASSYKRLNKKSPIIVSFDKSYLFTPESGISMSVEHRKEQIGKVVAKKILNMLNGEKEESVYFDWN